MPCIRSFLWTGHFSLLLCAVQLNKLRALSGQMNRNATQNNGTYRNSHNRLHNIHGNPSFFLIRLDTKFGYIIMVDPMGVEPMSEKPI